ncbi:MAG: hypothetical protein AAGA96_01755 [Verrucomicrobiota bacterium]
MKKLRIVAVGLAAISLTHVSSAREFTSTTGQKIQAEITFVSGENVTLVRADGQQFEVPANRFSEADQAYIAEWAEANRGKVPEHLKNKLPRMTMRVSNGKTSKDADQFTGYVDENKQKVRITAVMENYDAIYPIVDAKLTMMVFGESPETRKRAIVYKQEFKEIDLPLNEEKTYEGQGFELWYDDYGAMYGHKYEGYAVFLEDPEGKILHEVTIPSTAAKYLENLKKLKTGDVYDRGYAKSGTVSLDKSVKPLK